MFIALCVLPILISFDVSASGISGDSSNTAIQPENQATPPASASQTEISRMPETINACGGKNEGDSCVFNENKQKIIGKCEKSKEGKMNCTPPK